MARKIHYIKASDISQIAKNPVERILATRQFGGMFYDTFLEQLKNIPTSETVELSFDGIRVIDASFTDEVLGRLVVHRVIDKVELAPVYCSHLQDSHLDNIQYTLEARLSRQAELRNCVIPIQQRSNDLILMGKCEDGFQKVFDLLRAMKQLTARQVADTLDLSLQAASSRLKALYDYGLAFRQEVRDEQGKQFTYQWIL